MHRDEALRRLREHRETLERVGVSELFVYGSVARDEADRHSDVDLLVESASPRFTIFDLVEVKALCQDILSASADVHHHGGLKRSKTFRRNVSPDLIRVF